MKKTKKIIVFKNDLSAYKEYNFSLRSLFLMASGAGVVISVVLFLLANFIFSATHNLKIQKLKRTNDLLWENIIHIKSQLNVYSSKINDIVQNDEQLRLALNLPPINPDVRSVGVGGVEISSELSNYSDLFSKKDFSDFRSVLERVNKLGKEVDLEVKSYSDLVFTFRQKEDSVRYVPCIRPVPNAPITSRFGKRLHPIQKVIKDHDGVDLMANVGTPIYAPADGVVTFVGKNGGYGRFMKIDHLKGFESRYGHMSKINVKLGQRVKRGDKIAEVGNSGISTGPHLHFEVLYHKNRLDPSEFMID